MNSRLLWAPSGDSFKKLLVTSSSRSICSTSRRNAGSSLQAESSNAIRSPPVFSRAAWNSSTTLFHCSGCIALAKLHLESLGPDLPFQPGARGSPVSFYRDGRYFEEVGGFFHREPAKVSQLHDLPLAGIHLFQPVERDV